MGEGEKREEEKKNVVEEAAGAKNVEGDEKKEGEKPAGDKEAKDELEQLPTPPPPKPPQEIVLKVYMHCEGCARKVRRCLRGFQGVEDVLTDCRAQKVVVKGEKADPLKVLERIQRKSHRKVELLSPIPEPPPPPEEANKAEVKEEAPKPEEKKQEVITVLLKVHMHCEACAQEIKKRIRRMKGVESAESDLKSSQVTVKGALEATKLVDYVYKRTGKHAVVVKVEPEKKEGEEKGKEESKEEKKAEAKEEEGKKGEGENKEKDGAASVAGGEATAPPAAKGEAGEEEGTKMEVKKNEQQFYYLYPAQYHYQVYPQRLGQDFYPSYPPQYFSDENPNACSVM